MKTYLRSVALACAFAGFAAAFTADALSVSASGFLGRGLLESRRAARFLGFDNLLSCGLLDHLLGSGLLDNLFGDNLLDGFFSRGSLLGGDFLCGGFLSDNFGCT